MNNNLTARQNNILEIIANNQDISTSQIKSLLNSDIATSTLNRDLALLVGKNYLIKQGTGRATVYRVSPKFKVLVPVKDYFAQEVDSRNAQGGFNNNVFETLGQVELLTQKETQELTSLQKKYQENIKSLPSNIYQKEIERLTIELSWKSSQIEGNTYSLLETELLFKDKQQALGKSQEEAIMLLNHKSALDYMLNNTDIANSINIKLLQEVHYLLTKDLKINANIRKHIVGITGSQYKPLDNEHQIKEALENMCDLINSKNNIFEKALLAISLISYIQPFEDGNKRTGRMIGNAILISNNACPLSYRSVEALDYKQAMLLFYEQNNLSLFKEIFIEQNKFAYNNYFL